MSNFYLKDNPYFSNYFNQTPYANSISQVTTTNSTPTSTSWTDNLSKYGSILGGLGQIGQAGAGLMNAYTGYKNYKMAKEQFGFERALAQRNLANQAKLINNAIMSSANVAAGLSALPTGTTAQNQAIRDKHMADAENRKVSGTL